MKANRRKRNPRTTSDVRIEIRDGRISSMGDIGDLLEYYSDYFPVQLGQGLRDDINLTYFPGSKEVAAKMHFTHKDGKRKINYDIVFYRGGR